MFVLRIMSEWPEWASVKSGMKSRVYPFHRWGDWGQETANDTVFLLWSSPCFHQGLRGCSSMGEAEGRKNGCFQYLPYHTLSVAPMSQNDTSPGVRSLRKCNKEWDILGWKWRDMWSTCSATELQYGQPWGNPWAFWSLLVLIWNGQNDTFPQGIVLKWRS